MSTNTVTDLSSVIKDLPHHGLPENKISKMFLPMVIQTPADVKEFKQVIALINQLPSK
jgi:hypothetical protein